MRAARYEKQGAARDVLEMGELPDPEPGEGEVLVRVHLSGVNPGEITKRQGWLGSTMDWPLIVPHSDGAGVIEAVGPGVDPARRGQRVWVHHAQSYRPRGTAAELTAVPETSAVPLPDGVPDEIGACLGIPGITAHRGVHVAGDVAGRTVLVHGALGAVGSLAAQLAQIAGAQVIATVRRRAQVEPVDPRVAATVIALEDDDAPARIREVSGGGVDHLVDVSLSDDIDLDAAVVRNGSTIASYGTREERTSLPFWPLLFDNVSLHLIGSNDLPDHALRAAERDLSAHAARLAIPIRAVVPLERIAEAHEAVEAGGTGRVLVDLRPDRG